MFLVLQDLLEKAEQQANLTIGVLVSIVVIILTVLFKLIFGGKKQVTQLNLPPHQKNVFIETLARASIYICMYILNVFNLLCAGKS